MSDRLFCPHCINTDDQHAIWTACLYELPSPSRIDRSFNTAPRYAEPETPGWMIVGGIVGGLVFVLALMVMGMVIR